MFKVIQGLPSAHAAIKGSETYESIRGNVYLYEVGRAAASTASIFMKEAAVREIHRMNLRMPRAIIIPKGCLIPGMRVIFRR